MLLHLFFLCQLINKDAKEIFVNPYAEHTGLICFNCCQSTDCIFFNKLTACKLCKITVAFSANPVKVNRIIFCNLKFFVLGNYFCRYAVNCCNSNQIALSCCIEKRVFNKRLKVTVSISRAWIANIADVPQRI